jgi:hypothetical protein
VLTPGNYTVSFWQAAGQWNSFVGDTTTNWEVGLGSACVIGNTCGGSGFVGEIDYSPLMSNQSEQYVAWGELTTGSTATAEMVTLNFTVPQSASNTPQILSFVAIGNIAVPPIVFLDGVDLEQVPEPGTLLMMAVGLLGLGVVGIRRRARPGAA